MYILMKDHFEAVGVERECYSEKIVKKQSLVNYQDKNLDFIQKLKQRKQRQCEEKQKQQKRKQNLKERLRKKIVDEVHQYRLRQLQSKQIFQNSKISESPFKTSVKKHIYHADLLPKVYPSNQKENDLDACGNRYLRYMNDINQRLREKKEEEGLINKKQRQFQKNNQSPVTICNPRQETHIEMMKSHSIEKSSQITSPTNNPKSKNKFQEKHSQFLDKIKKKRDNAVSQMQEQNKKQSVRKEKLKEFVMHTVKKNVLDGVYDHEIRKRKQLFKGTLINIHHNEQDNQSDGSSNINSKMRKMRAFPYVTDLNEWKKKNRITPETKVFIITGGYPDLRRAIIERGWVENPDPNSPCFDFKWTLQGRQIQYPHLTDFQMVNHYQKNGVITTKVGLCKNIRNMTWINTVHMDDFYPKCFDLSDQEDYTHFLEYFKICKSQSILHQYMKKYKLKQFSVLQKIKLRVKVALDICQRNILDINEIIDKKKFQTKITNKEWDILIADDVDLQAFRKKKHHEWLKQLDAKYDDKKPMKIIVKKEIPQNQFFSNKRENFQQQVDFLTYSVITLLQQYQKKFIQSSLIDVNNTWILKPAGLSRGRGITCYNNLYEIENHIKLKQSLWVAQKYIERPLIILKRKFDIRQWVLVTDLNPLTIWFYDQCYIRFSVLDYSADNVDNKFIHLTNNSIGTLHKDFDASSIKGNMFHMKEFSEYLQNEVGFDIFNEKIKPQMKDIVIWSLQSAQEYIENRKNTHEMFGYDFMIDEAYKVWLIEINSSPAMDYSTHVTAKLVKEVSQDTAKVLIDYNFANRKIKNTIDTGKYKLLHRGIQIPDKPITTGLNLNIQGTAVRRMNKRKSKNSNTNSNNNIINNQIIIPKTSQQNPPLTSVPEVHEVQTQQ